jgi:hypothetical protein
MHRVPRMQPAPRRVQPGTKAFGSNMCDTCFPKHFWASNNIVKYVGTM